MDGLLFFSLFNSTLIICNQLKDDHERLGSTEPQSQLKRNLPLGRPVVYKLSCQGSCLGAIQAKKYFNDDTIYNEALLYHQTHPHLGLPYSFFMSRLLKVMYTHLWLRILIYKEGNFKRTEFTSLAGKTSFQWGLLFKNRICSF